MKANFQSIKGHKSSQEKLDQHASYIGARDWISPVRIDSMLPPPPGYEGYHTIDVIGENFIWLNETFTKDKVAWYVWFDSVFLIPEEMASFLSLKWPNHR